MRARPVIVETLSPRIQILTGLIDPGSLACMH